MSKLHLFILCDHFYNFFLMIGYNFTHYSFRFLNILCFREKSCLKLDKNFNFKIKFMTDTDSVPTIILCSLVYYWYKL